MSKLIDFVGSKLTHGSFHQMCLEMSKQIAITTPAALKLEALAPQYADTVRRELVDLHHRIVARVNAVAELDGTPEVETFIAYANKVAEHYRVVMANQAKKSGGGEAPEPVTEEDAK